MTSSDGRLLCFIVIGTHRITEYSGLEGTFKSHVVQCLDNNQGRL